MLLSRTGEETLVSDVTCVENSFSVLKVTIIAERAVIGMCVPFVLRKRFLSD
jgi:hypothetical protein